MRIYNFEVVSFLQGALTAPCKPISPLLQVT
jgi:hypothetical protein